MMTVALIFFVIWNGFFFAVRGFFYIIVTIIRGSALLNCVLIQGVSLHLVRKFARHLLRALAFLSLPQVWIIVLRDTIGFNHGAKRRGDLCTEGGCLEEMVREDQHTSHSRDGWWL